MVWEANDFYEDDFDDLGDFDLMGSLVGVRNRLDELERHLWLDVWRSPVLEAVQEEGIEWRSYGPILAMSVATLPKTPMLNFALGATERGAVADGHLATALEWLESLGVDFRVPIAADEPETGAAEDLLNRKGYERAEIQARFVRDTSPPEFPHPPGIGIDEHIEFTEGFDDLVVEGFELEPMAGCLFGCLPERQDWRCYIAFDEVDEYGGCGSMMVQQKVAQLAFAAASEEVRGGGCHMALLRRRILDAAAAKCHTMVAHVTESPENPDLPSPGCRNLVRAGFKQASVRQTWRPSLL